MGCHALLQGLNPCLLHWQVGSLPEKLICPQRLGIKETKPLWTNRREHFLAKNTHATTKVASVVSDSMQPHGLQPFRLIRPWDSPGKNTGAGCHFLLQCMKVKSESEVAQSCPTLSDPMDCSLPGLSVHGILQARTLEWVAISFSNA